MFLFEKKIVYLSLFEDGVKAALAGFVRISRERDDCRLDIHIRHVTGLEDGEYALFLVLKNRELPWGGVTVRRGGTEAVRRIPLSGDKVRFSGKEFGQEELCGILIRPDERRWITGYWQEPERIRALEREAVPEQTRSWQEEKAPFSSAPGPEKGREVSSEPAREARQQKSAAALEAEIPEKRMPSAIQAQEKESPLHGTDRYPPEFFGENIRKSLTGGGQGDKWEQLCRRYKSVHPFGDERMYLSIEPRDFTILQPPYQRLVNNSFLLHGFYNYRHLLLGPDEEIGTSGETCFYLGVPGTYFEREKMVAVMFGFEGFECNGPVETGKFGYYMRRVEL